ncbi:MAG: TPD domain-containing protein [Euryarchaeota archaeon]|nr:TPD domain-containing protein [Euryarchaeota archaeon]MBT3971745.1 TPD domain-containing protein [Euryarchaeota archaeon]MBT4406264.1 TPD domain-containing protein [Euryarchaeota archaeon]
MSENNSNNNQKRQGGGRNNRRRNKSKARKHGGPPRKDMLDRYEEFNNMAYQKAIDRFSQDPLPMAFPANVDEKYVELSWVSNPISLTSEQEVAKFVVRRGEFGFLPDERVSEIAVLVDDSEMTLDQALSLRSALLQEKTVYGHHRLKGKSRELKRLYDEGVGIIDLTQRYDFPPMNIFRTILAARGWSKSRIKESLKNAEKKLNERDLAQFKRAEEEDRVANVDQTETHLRAELFEDILCDWFEENGVRFRRQGEMVKEQNLAHGRPLKTPDLLILDDVRINGQPVAWIDAKHYYGGDVGFQRKKTTKQMLRYVEEWGQGAIVFRHGYCENLHIPGTILLDSSPLDLSRLSPTEDE